MDLNSLLEQGVTVITASRRLAHALRLSYAQHAQDRGQKVWQTPRILPWGTWLRQQYLETRAANLQSRSSLYALTPAQARVLWDEVVANSRQADGLLNPSSAARLAAGSWRRLHDYLIPLERLKEFDTAEPAALHSWCSEFMRRCTALQALDEARLPLWAHESGFTPAERLAFAGFEVMPPAMARLLERWREQGWVADAAQRAETGHAADTVESLPGHSISVVGAADHDEELHLAAAWARDQVSKGMRNVGVIVPDLQTRRAEVQRAFEDAIAPGRRQVHADATDLPIAIAAPAPLASYPMVDAAVLVLQLAVGNASSQIAGRLLRSPFIAGAETERGRRASADFRLRKEQRDRWDWASLERWAGMMDCDQLQLAARNLNSLLRSATGNATASQWAERFHQFWMAIGWPGQRSRDSAEHQTWEKFYGTLSEFGALDAVAGRMNLRRAISRWQSLLNDTPFEPKTSGAAITVIDAATSTGMGFDALWVSGLHADRWPAPVNPDPLIPLELQRAAQIPQASATTVLQLATQQLRRWRADTRVLVLSWPRRDGDIELIRSPLLDTVRPTSELAVTDRTQPLRQTIFQARPVLESLLDEYAPTLPRQAAKGGARILELQSHCAFRAQAELRLRAQLLPKVTVGVKPVDRGAILHRTLEELWGTLQTQERLLACTDLELESRVRDSVQRHTAAELVPDTPQLQRLAQLETDSLVRRIMQLLTQERQRPAFRVRRAESAESYTIGGLSITLRPDRIDELAAGGELLIDYKLGANHLPQDWLDKLPGRPSSPQLPLYALAHADRLRGLAYAVLAPGAVEYRGWSDGADAGPGVTPYAGKRIDRGDPPDWQALMQHWRFTLTGLAQQYVAGDARVDPLPHACDYCHLSTLCRVYESVASEATTSEAGQDDQ